MRHRPIYIYIYIYMYAVYTLTPLKRNPSQYRLPPSQFSRYHEQTSTKQTTPQVLILDRDDATRLSIFLGCHISLYVRVPRGRRVREYIYYYISLRASCRLRGAEHFGALWPAGRTKTINYCNAAAGALEHSSVPHGSPLRDQ